jgi:hypothetical protein
MICPVVKLTVKWPFEHKIEWICFEFHVNNPSVSEWVIKLKPLNLSKPHVLIKWKAAVYIQQAGVQLEKYTMLTLYVTLC